MNHYWKWLLITISIAFGPGYQTISIAPIIAIWLLLDIWKDSKSWIQDTLFTWISCTIGSFLAYAGCFESTKTPSLFSPNTWAVLPFVLGFSFAITSCFLFDVFFIRPVKCHSWVRSLLGFPMIWTFVWVTIYNTSSTGDFGGWHIALASIGFDSLTRGTSWLFGSVSGGCFVFSAFVHSIVYKNSVKYFILVPILVGSISGLQLFYQQPLRAAPYNLPATCMIRGNFNITESYLKQSNGDLKLILWSEESMMTFNETETIETAKYISGKYNALLGITYAEKIRNSTYKYRNKFALVVPVNGTGKLAFIYQKAHPVPLVEKDVEPGNLTIHTYETSFATIGAAICFDYNFPFLDHQLKHVNLMLQPSATWGTMGPFHAFTNKLRSLDHGLTTFRCSSFGVSGVYSDHIVAQKITMKRGEMMHFDIPIYSKRFSLFQILGDWLFYLSIVCVAFWIVLSFYIQKKIEI